MEKKKLYPYLILLPDDPDLQKEILTTIFGSKVAQELIVNIDNGNNSQKDLIENLKYSNKTIINYLKNLVKLKILEEDSIIKDGYRRLFYKLTTMGEWFSSLLSYRAYKSDELKEFLEQLFQIYLKHAIHLLLEHGFDQDQLRDIFEYALSTHLKEDYISKSKFKKYLESIESLSEELSSILESLKSMDEEKKNEVLKIDELKNLFVEFDEFYGILKNSIQKLNLKLKKY